MSNNEIIDPSLIDLDTSQPKRYDPLNEEHVRNLLMIAEQISEIGQQYPVLVTPYFKISDDRVILGHDAEKQKTNKIRYFCIDGEKRTRAIRDILKLKEIKVKLVYDVDFYTLLKIQFITCAKRVELNAADYADALSRWSYEYLKKYTEQTENDAINEIARITGYSLSFVHGRDLLNLPELSEEAKELVREGKLKINALQESARLKKTFRDIAWKHEIDKATRRKTGEIADTTPLRYRHIKHQQDKLEEKVQQGKITAKEEKDAMTDLIHNGGRFSDTKRDTKGNFARYKIEAISWYDRLSNWNIDALSLQEIDILAGLIGDLQTLFQNMQAQKLDVGDLSKAKSKLHNKTKHKTK